MSQLDGDLLKARKKGVAGPKGAPTLDEIGSTGLNRSGHQVNEEFLTALRGSQGRKVLREMADNDPVIGAGLWGIEQAVGRLDWHFEAGGEDPESQPSQEAKEFVEGCWEDMNQPWTATLADVCTMNIPGWSALEIVYKRRVGPSETDPKRRSKFTDGKIGWRKWAPRAQDTLWGWVFDEDGGIAGMMQQDPYNSTQGVVTIPIEKMLLFRTTSRGSNPEGRSLIRNCFQPWFYKRRIQEFEAIGIERDLAGLPLAYAPAAWMMNDAPDAEKAAADAIRDIVENIKRNEQDGVLLPHITDDHGNRMVTLELLSSGGQRQFDTDAVVSRYDQRIAMAMLADWVMLGHENVGSQSLGETKYTAWEMAVDAIACAIEEVVNRHAIPRLLRLNGMDVTVAPRLVHGDVKGADLTALASYVGALTTAGLLTPDAGLEEHLRVVGDLPPAEHDLEIVHPQPDPQAEAEQMQQLAQANLANQTLVAQSKATPKPGKPAQARPGSGAKPLPKADPAKAKAAGKAEASSRSQATAQAKKTTPRA